MTAYVLRVVLALIALPMAISAYAADLPKELYYVHDKGTVTITTTPCDIQEVAQPFHWQAFATALDGSTHKGCWYRTKDGVHIYYEELNQTGLYEPSWFKPTKDSI